MSDAPNEAGDSARDAPLSDLTTKEINLKFDSISINLHISDAAS